MTKSPNSFGLRQTATGKNIYNIKILSAFALNFCALFWFCRFACLPACHTMPYMCLPFDLWPAMHLIAFELDVILLKSALFILNISFNLQFGYIFALSQNIFSPVRRNTLHSRIICNKIINLLPKATTNVELKRRNRLWEKRRRKKQRPFISQQTQLMHRCHRPHSAIYSFIQWITSLLCIFFLHLSPFVYSSGCDFAVIFLISQERFFFKFRTAVLFQTLESRFIVISKRHEVSILMLRSSGNRVY